MFKFKTVNFKCKCVFARNMWAHIIVPRLCITIYIYLPVLVT